jgi:hypothetical protein
VVQLDDLGRVEVRRGDLGQAHHHHRGQREVRRDDAVRPAPAELLGEQGEVVVRKTGGADDRVDPVHRQPRNGGPRRVGDGEVDDHLGGGVGERLGLAGDRHALDVLALRTGIDRGDQLELGIDRDRPAHRRPHPPSGPAHSDAQYPRHGG